MSFVSAGYLFFLAVSCLIYYRLPVKYRIWSLLFFSLFFFWTNSGHLIIWLLYSTLTAYFFGKLNGKNKNVQLICAIILLLAPLIYFKWNGFFLGKISDGKDFIAVAAPLGISFYTLSLISYCVECHRKGYASEKKFGLFLLFSSFFPHIVQGPIARYHDLKKSLFRNNKFEYDDFCKGCQLILWGFLLKLVIADRAAVIVDHVFEVGRERQGLYIAITFVLYSLQLYADFLGCVNIAIGSAQLFGVKLSKNFEQPYLAISIRDFWRRWHISLSSWLKDYIYIPLGGNRKGPWRKRLNILLTFAVSGLWHGAGLHFFLWGLLHGAYQVIGDIFQPVGTKIYVVTKISQNSKSVILIKRMFTFTLVTFAWALFRAESVGHFSHLINNLFGEPHFEVLWDAAAFELLGMRRLFCLPMLITAFILFLVDNLHEKGVGIREKIALLPLPLRWGLYMGAIAVVVIFGVYGPEYSAQQFIYGQF